MQPQTERLLRSHLRLQLFPARLVGFSMLLTFALVLLALVSIFLRPVDHWLQNSYRQSIHQAPRRLQK